MGPSVGAIRLQDRGKGQIRLIGETILETPSVEVLPFTQIIRESIFPANLPNKGFEFVL